MANGTVLSSLLNGGSVDPQRPPQKSGQPPRRRLPAPVASSVTSPVATPYTVEAKLAQAQLARNGARPTSVQSDSRPTTIWQDGRTLSMTARRGTYLNIVV